MKKPPLNGMAVSESFYSFEESSVSDSNIANPSNLHNKLPAASLGNSHRNAKNLAVLLRNMQSGMSTYQKVLSSLEPKYGAEFRINYHHKIKKTNRGIAMSQQTKNLFLDQSLWDQPWFDEMPTKYQMAYFILWTECDNVGVWQPHTRKLCFRLKEKEFPLDDFFKKVNLREPKISELEDGSWWILDYLPFQVKTLTPNNKPHISYIEGLMSHNLLKKYAEKNPGSVNFKEVLRLENYAEIEDSEEKGKAEAAFRNLKDKGLVSPLKDSCETLGRVCQDSKDKDKEEKQEKAQYKDEDTEVDTSPLSIKKGYNLGDPLIKGEEDSE